LSKIKTVSFVLQVFLLTGNFHFKTTFYYVKHLDKNQQNTYCRL